MNLLTIDEAAARLRISVRTLHRLLAEGRGPVLTHVGGKRFVQAEQLAAWVEQNSPPRVERAA